jgi:hypothetical protein
MTGPATAYRRGYAAERRTAELLAAEGYLVMQSRGSHGVADLAAIKPGQVLLIQVKLGEAILADGWFNDLYAAALDSGALAIIADYPKRGRLRLRLITGWHAPRSKHWPTLPFVTDEVTALA